MTPRPGYRLRACDVLFDEHRVVNKKLSELGPDLAPGASGAAFAGGLGALLGALARELPPHFAKEEEALFPVLESVTGQGFPPVEVMKAEHRVLKDHFAALEEAQRRLAAAPGAREARAQAARHLYPMVETLEAHIVKEDSVLLVVVSEQLEARHDGKILRVFDEIDREGRRWG